MEAEKINRWGGTIKKKGENKYKCEKCNYTLTTNFEAIERHMDSHTKNRFIKIGRCADKKTYRPIEHIYDERQGIYTYGPGCKAWHIIAPENLEIIEGRAKCRVCGKYDLVIFKDQEKLRRTAQRIKALTMHEKKCK